MYNLSSPAVYVHEDVMADSRYLARMQRVVEALQTPVIPQTFSNQDLPDMIRGGLYANRVAMGTLEEVRDPALLFRTYQFDDQEEKWLAWGQEQDPQVEPELLGYGAFRWWDSNLPQDPERRNRVCRPCWRIHLQEGCVHRCAYCGRGGLLISMLNVEEYCEALGQLIARHPWQETYLLDDDADPPCLEPEQGTLSYLIEYFGTLQGRYLIIHTKTWNTEWLRGLKHNGNTILVWSLSAQTQSTLLEPNAGTTEQRIEAARIAQEAGYTIRYKFKPIIPVRGWEEEAARAVELLFQRTRPDVISLCCLMWMDVEDMLRVLPRELLDESCVQAALEQRETMQGLITGPLPPEMRAKVYLHYLREIRRHAPDLPVSLSTESFEMWRQLGPELGATATSYVCGCGPNSTPGRRKLGCHPFRAAVRNDAGLLGTC